MKRQHGKTSLKRRLDIMVYSFQLKAGLRRNGHKFGVRLECTQQARQNEVESTRALWIKRVEAGRPFKKTTAFTLMLPHQRCLLFRCRIPAPTAARDVAVAVKMTLTIILLFLPPGNAAPSVQRIISHNALLYALPRIAKKNAVLSEMWVACGKFFVPREK